ncbi:hypothetical protein ACFVTX_05265 [Agromyces sp. NPDC058136]|uniref:hypothetical protein n=1 Tax=Agromyces sp. NPDC058136 TaxID=3346354 RepID=UPI0036D767B0
MGRRRVIPVPHREFFRGGGGVEETIALACTCPRAQDHWYAEPHQGGGRGAGTDVPAADDPAADDSAAGAAVGAGGGDGPHVG